MTRILDILRMLVVAYPNQHIGKETIQVYVSELDDISIEKLMDAAHKLIRESKYFPTIAELRQVALRPRYIPTSEIKEFD